MRTPLKASRALPVALALALAPAAHALDAGLAYVSIRNGQSHIFLKSGSQERQLTRGEGSNSQPHWAPDGRRLAFTTTRDGLLRVYVMRADGSAQQRVGSGNRIETAPSWSPDGRLLAYYSADPETGAAELRITELAGGRTQGWAANGKDKGPSRPTWSADGRRVAFTGMDDKGKLQVWILDRAEGTVRDVSSAFSPRGKAFAAISPDGRHVAYSADTRPSVDLVITTIDTGESRSVTVPGAAVMHETPQWSPDGKRIAFGSTRDDPELSRMDVFVMEADGSGVRNLTRHPHEDYDPRWTHDGRGLVFASLRTGSSQLYEVDVASGETRRLTDSRSHDTEHAPGPAARARTRMSAQR